MTRTGDRGGHVGWAFPVQHVTGVGKSMRSTSGAAAAITSAIRHMSSASRAPLSRVVRC